MDIVDTDGQSTDRLAELRVSARGWHGVQLAVLGFIGLCGVLQHEAGQDKPDWLRVLAGLLVLAAFGLACVSTVLVALAAWPVYGAAAGTAASPDEASRTSGRLRLGIALTFVAVAMLALATSSAWWPGPSGGTSGGAAAVRVSTRAGAVCGDLGAPSTQGVVAVSSSGRLVEVALSDVLSIQPVDGCG